MRQDAKIHATPSPRRANPSLLSLLVFASLAAACHGKPAPTAGSGTAQQKSVPKSGVVVLEASGRTLRIKVEIVRSDEDRARGLMFRKQMPEMVGMLFVFPKTDLQSFWMKNTYIPLDMVFLSEEKKVVGVVANAEPMTLNSRQVDRPSRYVLEVNGGFCQRHGVKVGTSMRIIEDPPEQP